MKSNKPIAAFRVLMLFVMLAAAATSAHAQVPTPGYSGNFWNRSTMTGDWGGVRNDWANKGITLDFSLTQAESSVVEGGLNSKGAYGGRGDFIINLDTKKMGLWPGGFFLIEGEVNYSEGET